MKITADESVDKPVVDRLRVLGYEVFYVAEMAPGIADDEVLRRSRESNSLLVTADKDFGDLIFRQRLLHSGVMLLRLEGLASDQKAEVAGAAVETYRDQLPGRFCVVSKRSIRLRAIPA